MSPRTKEQFEKIRESSRTEILDAALELFAKNGFHATSISLIAEKAGISKGLMYNYFKSKDELLKNIIEGGFQLLNNLMTEISLEPDPRTALEKIIRLSIGHIKGNITYWKLYMSLILQSAAQKDMERLMINFRNEATEVLSQIFRLMGERDPYLKAFALGTQLDGIGFNMVSASESFPIDELEEYLIKTYCSPAVKRKKK
jgi:AcrR family transcriptional regulator